jgi:ABC-type antimicrobial peptide transport system permease subunit
MLRRQEIGIRMALGAGRQSMILLLVRQLRRPLLGGLALGLAAAIPSGYAFSGVPLFVKPFDPPVMAIVALFLIVITALAAALPAWRALRADPLQSLRSE